MKTLKKLPLPITGISLALASLGNLLRGTALLTSFPWMRNVLLALSVMILLAVCLYFVFYLEGSKKQLDNIVVASVFPTFPMTLSIISTYAAPFNLVLGKFIWIIALILQIIIMIYFFTTHFFPFKLEKIFPSFFVIFVGFVIGAVSAPPFGFLAIGKISLILGAVGYVCCFILVASRLFGVGPLPEPAIYTEIIFLAPINLLIVGYINSYSLETPTATLIVLCSISMVTFIGLLFRCPKYVRLPFYPSIAGAAFSYTIFAMAMKMSTALFSKVISGNLLTILQGVVAFATILAVVVVSVVLIRYLLFIFLPENKTNKSATESK